MAICMPHVSYHQEILAIPGFLQDPILIMGVQDIFHGCGEIDQAFPQATLRECLLARGFNDVREVDLHDERAEVKIDLAVQSELPAEIPRPRTVIDIGTIEHVANPHICLQNYVSWLRTGGHLFIHTPVKGHCCHGLFTFAPEYIPVTLSANGFEVVYEKYSGWKILSVEASDKAICDSPDPDILGWYVARKVRHERQALQHVQQGRYQKKDAGD